MHANFSTAHARTYTELNDKAEAVSIKLEQVRYTFDLLAGDYVKEKNYAVFLAIESLLNDTNQQLQALIAAIPAPSFADPLYKAVEQQKALISQFGSKAFELVALSKTINEWATDLPADLVCSGLVDSGDIISLSGLAQSIAQSIVDQADQARLDVVEISRGKSMNHQHNAIDSIIDKLDQLNALLIVGTAEDFPTFNHQIVSDYMMTCSQIAESIRTDFRASFIDAKEVQA